MAKRGSQGEGNLGYNFILIRDIAQLKKRSFDLVVIGGGINGCAIARDAALRGASVALIEKDDFASGASGKTTKLIHGGIRYLEQLNFKLVSEALGERSILLKTVPRLVKPLDFIIPVYKDDPRSLLKIKAGVCLYDLLAAGKNICSHRPLSKNKLILLEPHLDSRDLKGGVLYCDAQMDDIRLCLDNVLSASTAGCCAANKVAVTGFIKEKNSLSAVRARDKLNEEDFIIKAGVVINATGAWSNQIVRMDDPDAVPITRPTKGTHIVYRKLPHERAILLSSSRDKRVFFLIPWRGYTLIGTTDTDYDSSPDEVYADSKEVDYLLAGARRIFPGENITKEGIIATFAALRPLVNTQGKLSWKVSREHLIQRSASGLISVVGGKYTTYRRLAQEVVDLALSGFKGRSFKKCTTADIGPSFTGYDQPDFRRRIEHAVKEEMANTLVDLMSRRIQVALRPGNGIEHLEEYAKIMGEFLRWTQAEKESQIRAYREYIRNNANF